MGIVRYTHDPKNPAKLTAAEKKRLDAMTDEDINYSDIPDMSGAAFVRVSNGELPQKRQLTIRLDDDVLSWLRAKGKGYQTRINRILRAAMESKPPRTRWVATRKKPIAAKRR